VVWLVGAFLVLWVALGPVILVLAAALLAVPRVRWWVQGRAHVSRRVVAWTAATAATVGLLVVVVPDGWLPIPPAPGSWAGPSYVGRPASPHQVPAEEVPPNPHRSAGEPADLPGPLGRQPEVDTAWFGLQRCGRLEQTETGLLVALCAAGDGRALRVVDPQTLRPLASQDLPDLPEGSACDGESLYLDDAERAVVGTGDRQVLAVRTSHEGEPQLETDATWDLKPYVAYGDCLVSVAPDWSGRIWWTSHAGLVGTLDPTTGQVGVVDLGEEVGHDVAVDAEAAYVVTDEAVHRLVVGGDGTPQVTWRSEYDGVSGSAPVLVDRGTVAITDEVEDRLGVRFLARDDGRTVCRQSVFDKGEGATRSTLADLGAGVVVANDAGYASSRRALLGFTAGAGVARVDLTDDGCAVTWTTDAVSPASGVVASRPNGLLYAWAKRPSLTGVSAWYLTAIDADSGRRRWGVRTGTGLLAGSDGSTVTLGRDGSAYLGTRAGLVRVHDRR
jgi:outer membrane protein assembly factor BamB